jgi:hypothetical protein
MIMLGCYFTASGKKFDVDSFLRTTTLKPDAIFYRGQPLTPLPGRVEETGFSVTICETRVFGDLDQQIPRALRFLRKSQTELARLAKRSEVTRLRLTFPYCPAGKLGSEFFPAELLALAGASDIDIALSVYPGPAPSQKLWDRNVDPDARSKGGPRQRLPIRAQRRVRHRSASD